MKPGWTTQDREKLGLRQAEIARALKVSATFISEIERGKSPCPEYMIPQLPKGLREFVAQAAIAYHQQAIERLQGCVNGD